MNKLKRKFVRVSRDVAIGLAANNKCVSLEIAKKYTDSELRDILKKIDIKSAF